MNWLGPLIGLFVLWGFLVLGTIAHMSGYDRIFAILPWRFRLRFGVGMWLDGVVTLMLYLTTLAGVLVYGYQLLVQIYDWLQEGTWVPFSIVSALIEHGPAGVSDWADYPESWLGIHKVLLWLHPFVPSVVLFFVAMVSYEFYLDRARARVQVEIERFDASRDD